MTSLYRHAPGPWALRTDVDTQRPAAWIGPVLPHGTFVPIARTIVDEGLANARLIVTAPDLLQLVRQAMSHFQEAQAEGHIIDIRDWLRAAQAVIARIEGQS